MAGNELGGESSPYLKSLSHSPVHWVRWSEEAIMSAKEQGRPIFLSIGYSTCHFCHDMEDEVFSDPSVYEELNGNYVCIKIDREERPDIDHLYMDAASALTNQAAGWPLNLFLTAELAPLYAVTFLPLESTPQMMGFKDVLIHIRMLMESEEKELLLQQSQAVLKLIEEAYAIVPETIEQEDLDQALETIYSQLDASFGGIGQTPKFPMGYLQEMLLHIALAQEDLRAQYLVELTLSKMAQGGIYDQVGGGFSRYALDRFWQIPHFEKTLADNALLIPAYIDAYRFLGEKEYLETALATADFLLRDLLIDGQGFGGAIGAKDQDAECLYYTWTLDEVQDLLDIQEASLTHRYFNMSEIGMQLGRCVLYRSATLSEFAKQHGLEEELLKEEIALIKKKLLEKRSERTPLHRDEKVITSSNALAIHALARLGVHFLDVPYLKIATEVANYLLQRHIHDGILYRSTCHGTPKDYGFLDDYANLIKALLTLFEVTAESPYYEWALRLTSEVEQEFGSPSGLFYFNREDPLILIRRIDLTDASEPAGNSVMCENYTRLYQLTGDSTYKKRAEKMIEAAGDRIHEFPQASIYTIRAAHALNHRKLGSMILFLNERREGEEKIRRQLQKQLYPYQALFILSSKHNDPFFDAFERSAEETQLVWNPVIGETQIVLGAVSICEFLEGF